jgi:hypothetical protein
LIHPRGVGSEMPKEARLNVSPTSDCAAESLGRVAGAPQPIIINNINGDVARVRLNIATTLPGRSTWS